MQESILSQKKEANQGDIEQAIDFARHDTIHSSEVIETPKEIADSYRYLESIGSGSQGKVFRAKDLRNGRDVAIKQLSIGSVKNWKEYELFEREANVLQSLDIDGVAKFYDAREFLDGERPTAYIVQEYIEGQTLADLIKAGYRFPIHQVYDIIIQLLTILESLHQHDPAVIHRDIKPSNILMSTTGEKMLVYLIDFGAVANPQVENGGSTVAGTYGYMPPEQMMGHPVPQSDIYSLGATAVELFTGVPVDKIQVKDYHLVFEPYLQSIPAALTYTLRAMLEPKIEKRFCDCNKLRELFTLFKKGIYDIPKEIEESVSTHGTKNKSEKVKFEKELRQFNALNGAGCIQLWQQLSNITPRQIPSCYKHMKVADLSSKLFSKSLTRMRSLETSSMLEFFLLKWLKYTFWSIPLSIFLHEKLEKKTKSNVMLYQSLINMALFWLFFICMIFFLMIEYFKYFLIYIGITAVCAYVKSMKNSYPDFTPLSATHSKMFEMLQKQLDKNLSRLFPQIIQDGTKTIGTITDIQYVVQTEGIYVHNSTKQLVSPRRPLYKIKYSFNPADDSNPDDLHHEIYTHTPPEGHYAVGDSIPILYLISNKLNDYGTQNNLYQETVFSIPFPMPFGDNLSFEKRIGRSDIFNINRG